MSLGPEGKFRRWVRKQGEPVTHTSIQSPSACYSVPDKEYQKFLSVYRAVLQTYRGVLHFTERPKDVSFVRIDFDFKYPVVTGDADGKYLRGYTQTTIENSLKVYFEEISKVFEEPEIQAYVLEKESPTLKQETGMLKDGIHMVITVPMRADLQMMIRENVIERSADLFLDNEILRHNTVEDIIDKNVIKNSNWQLYGSSKPGSCAYLNTQVVVYKDNKIRLYTEEDDDEDGGFKLGENMVNILCMRRPNMQEPPLKENIDVKIEQFLCSLRERDIKSKIHTDNRYMRENTNGQNLRRKASPEEKELAEKLVNCLKPSRADDRDSWIKAGWALYNIDYELLPVWKTFSSISDKYNEDICENYWSKFKNGTLGIRSLRWWAYQDNPQRCTDITDEGILSKIDAAGKNHTHFTVAQIIKAAYPHDYVFNGSSRGPMWYRYMNSSWRVMHDACDLKIKMSTDISKRVKERGAYYKILSSENQVDASELNSLLNDASSSQKLESTIYNKIGDTLDEISKKLGDTTYKNKVLEQARLLFADAEFEGNLNSKEHLLGFPNGVYDFSNKEFREGCHDDMISFQTAFPYQKPDYNSEEFKILKGFIYSLFIIPEEREDLARYALNFMASALDGKFNRSREQMTFFTGRGSNGKSELTRLLNMTLKDYYLTMDVTLLTAGRGNNPGAATPHKELLRGKRLVVLQEPGTGEKSISTGQMKELTGNDEIYSRGLFKEGGTFMPQYSMIMTANNLPHIGSQDDGTWRRMTVIPFRMKFCESPDENIKTEKKIDVSMKDRLNASAHMFLPWLIDIHNSLTHDDLSKKNMPKEVRDATSSYKSETDIVTKFAMDQIEAADQEYLDGLGEDVVWLTENSAWTSFCKAFPSQAKSFGRADFCKKLDEDLGDRVRGKWKNKVLIDG